MTPTALAALHEAAMTSPRPWSPDEFAAFLADPLVHLHVAADGACFALGRSVAGEAELLTLATAPAFRRQGLARAALAAFDAEATRRGARTGFLEVAADNGAALALYRGAGWAEAGRRRGYYATAAGRVDALVLTRPFSALTRRQVPPAVASANPKSS